MRTYRTTEAVPWREVLNILYWHLGMRTRQVRDQLERGDMQMAALLALRLKSDCECVAGLRRFLGYRSSTRQQQEAEALLRQVGGQVLETVVRLDKQTDKVIS